MTAAQSQARMKWKSMKSADESDSRAHESCVFVAQKQTSSSVDDGMERMGGVVDARRWSSLVAHHTPCLREGHRLQVMSVSRGRNETGTITGIEEG